LRAKYLSMKIILITASLFATSLTLSQTPEVDWSWTYGGSNEDLANSVCATIDGGYIFAGYTMSFGADSNDAYLVKTDSLGDMSWYRLYGQSGYDDAKSVHETSDGGYILAGRSTSLDMQHNDMYVIKTNGAGDTLWVRYYGGNDEDYAESAIQISDGGYIIAGSTRQTATTPFEIYIVKTNSIGDTIWTRNYCHENGWKAYSVQQTSDHGFILAAHDAYYSGVEYNIYLVKVDSLGDSLWTRTYGGEDDDFVQAVLRTSDRGYILAGWTSSFGAGGSDVYIIKTDSLGNTMWDRTYGGTGGETAASIQEIPDRGYIIAGGTSSFGAENGDLYLVKIDAQGDTMWTMVYGGPDAEYGYSIDLTEDGGYIIAGAVSGEWDTDAWLVKTGPDTSATHAPSIEWVSHPLDFALHPAYPNPFNANTVIKYSLPRPGRIQLTICNILGQRIVILYKGFQSSGIHTVTWNASDHSSGIYFAQLQSADGTKTVKMVLIK
jgi:hypothetical protein